MAAAQTDTYGNRRLSAYLSKTYGALFILARWDISARIAQNTRPIGAPGSAAPIASHRTGVIRARDAPAHIARAAAGNRPSRAAVLIYTHV